MLRCALSISMSSFQTRTVAVQEDDTDQSLLPASKINKTLLKKKKKKVFNSMEKESCCARERA